MTAPSTSGVLDLARCGSGLRLLVLSLIVAFALGGMNAASLAQGDQSSDPDGDIKVELPQDGERLGGILARPLSPDKSLFSLQLPGSLVVPPQQLTVVATPSGGLIEAVYINADEPVLTGQVLARVRSPELIDIQRQYLTALSDAEFFDDRQVRLRSLYESRAIAEREVRAIDNDVRKARATLDQTRQVLALMGFSGSAIDALRKTRQMQTSLDVLANGDGVVTAVHARAGERVQSVSPLLTIARMDPLWVNVSIPTSHLNTIAIGSEVHIPAYNASGSVIRIGRSVDTQTQTAVVVAEIGAENRLIRPGLSVNVNVRANSAGGPSWIVPSDAVVRFRERTWVFVKTADGVVARPVAVLGEGAEGTSIRAEFAPSDQIVIRGIIGLLAQLTSASGGG